MAVDYYHMTPEELAGLTPAEFEGLPIEATGPGPIVMELAAGLVTTPALTASAVVARSLSAGAVAVPGLSSAAVVASTLSAATVAAGA